MKLKKLTHQEHCVLAAKVRRMEFEHFLMWKEVIISFGKTSKAFKALAAMRQNLIAVQCHLDTEYHKVTSDEQWEASGYCHVYYNYPVDSPDPHETAHMDYPYLYPEVAKAKALEAKWEAKRIKYELEDNL